jgi:RNA methyltransferase, TrmH family
MITKSEIKTIRSLHHKKFRDSENKYFIEGTHLVEEALKINSDFDIILVTPEFEERNQKFLTAIARKKIRTEKLPHKELEIISDTENSQGIFAVLKKKENSIENHLQKCAGQKKQIILALEGISDPGNLGTIIRSSDWFGIDAIIIGKKSVDLYNPKVIRSTMGSIFHLPIFQDIDLPEIISKLKKDDFKIYVTTLNGEIYTSFKYSQKAVFIFGNEAHGISNEILNKADTTITIPSFGKAESLNVGTAASVILAEIIRQGRK